MRAGCTGLKRAPGTAVDPSENQPTTSAITWVKPEWLYRSTLPSMPSFTTVRLATVLPAVKLRFETVPLVRPVGESVT